MPETVVTGAGETLHYTGRLLSPAERTDESGRIVPPYLPQPDLVETVNLALFLQRPLLLRGEPGCGKTRLAQAVALELGLPFRPWHVKSTSRARDGLYVYDALARLRDVQMAALLAKGQSVSDPGAIAAPENYVRLGPLGEAFETERRCVVLIDEIDKADIDFPNDLLDVLEDRRFRIEETGAWVEARHPPVIIVTSNDEKDLPSAFLRRCLFHDIAFPTQDRLAGIIAAHYADIPEALRTVAVARFAELRRRQEHDDLGGIKRVCTSELLDWVRALHHDPDGLERLEIGRPFPFPATLIKRREDAPYLESSMTGDGPAA